MEDLPTLFDLSEYPVVEPEPEYKNLATPVWTENKALLISRYLRYFVFITHHGTYLDAFAGPQAPDFPDTWAARMVLMNEPKWFRRFALFENDGNKFGYLNALCNEHHQNPQNRSVLFIPGDMNLELPSYLAANPIGPKEATFCLLDQHTFECDWTTVVALAKHKMEGNKIELFYFLAQGWLDRAVAALGNPKEKLGRWWGSDGWDVLMRTPGPQRGVLLARRFKSELGYRFSNAFPIFERTNGGRVMFWMIHASDHPEAPKLMVRAYNNAVAPLETAEQLTMELSDHSEGD